MYMGDDDDFEDDDIISDMIGDALKEYACQDMKPCIIELSTETLELGQCLHTKDVSQILFFGGMTLKALRENDLNTFAAVNRIYEPYDAFPIALATAYVMFHEYRKTDPAMARIHTSAFQVDLKEMFKRVESLALYVGVENSVAFAQGKINIHIEENGDLKYEFYDGT